jgi:GR25 family glycosyltransferase involved in LPS biosynthesis
MFKAYIINLTTPEDLFKNLIKEGIQTKLIRKINDNELTDVEIKNNTNLLYSYFGSKKSICNALSHIKAWKTFLQSNDNYAIICHDNVSIKQDFTRKLNFNLKYVPKNFDLLYLGDFEFHNYFNFLSFMTIFLGYTKDNSHKINKYINKPNYFFGLDSYLISRNGAEKLLKLLDKQLYFHLDYSIQNLYSKKLINIYSLSNKLVYETFTNKHPIWINQFLPNFFKESIFKIENFNFTICSFLFLLLGMFLSFNLIIDSQIILEATILFLLISIPELSNFEKNKDNILLHYLLFITPFLFFSNKN